MRICRVEETGYILSNSIKNGAFHLPGIVWTGRLLEGPDFSSTVVFDAHSLYMSDLHHSRLWFSRYCAYANKITHYTSVISLEFEYYNLFLKRTNERMQGLQVFQQCFNGFLSL